MVESVKAKAERSIFSIKKGTILSDLIPRLKLPHAPLFAKTDEQKVERKRKKMEKNRKWGLAPFFLRYGDKVD